jgi:hypothetical protein
MQTSVAGTVSKITLDKTNRLYYTIPTTRRTTMTNHNKIAADEFCNTTHTSPIDSYVVNRIRELEAQVNRLKQERDEACAAIEKPAQKASKFRNLTQQVNDVLDLTRGYDPNSLVGRMAALLEQTTFYKDLYYNTLTPAQRENPVPPKE